MILLALAACARHGPQAPAEARTEVRYRPVFELPGADAKMLVDAVPGGRWDAGLARVASELLALATDRRSVFDPASVALVAARVGFPGQVRAGRALNGGSFPSELADQAEVEARGRLLDVGIAKRDYGDGTVLWAVAWAPHLVDMDPVPRDLALDEALALRIDRPRGPDGQPAPPQPDLVAHAFLAPPDGPVQEIGVTPGVARWIDRFHTPGTWRVEVVIQDGHNTDVALLFSAFVDAAAPQPATLRPPPPGPPDPAAAETTLYAWLDDLRRDHGLKPVERFALYEPLAREHSAIMASSGAVAHTIDGVTPGVASRAQAVAHPGARHHEDVAAAASASDAWALVTGSPGHLEALLCEACTHASIGAALESSPDRTPRLFVTWELLEFPDGPPREIDHYNR